MPATYEPIATTTLGSAASSITFSSISGSYTDLRLILVSAGSLAHSNEMQFNNDTGSNYAYTILMGDGSTTSSYKLNNQTKITLEDNGAPTATNMRELITIDIFSYAGSTYKTCLVTTSNDKNGTGFVQRNVGLWTNVNAITSIKIQTTAGNFVVGTTATLYGILKA